MSHDPLLSALLTARVPRYTSYPPANRFSREVGPEAHARWLAALPPGAPVSLYVHVPFCRRLCWFCACRTQGTRSDAPLDSFLDHLAREVALVSALMPGGVPVSALHLGGGTPTLLSPDRLDRLAAMLREGFALSPGTEVSAEIDPCECDGPRLDALARMGLSRASIGVQDFEPRVQAAIGREQPFEATRAVVEAARARGVRSLNIDLLYGLPHQTEASLERTIGQVLDLAPDRIALYGYAHVPWMARRQKLIPEEALPGPEARLRLSARAREMLLAAGYVAIGIDHFAIPGDSMARAAQEGTLRRNFQGYTTDTAPALVALGPSAISRFPHGYAQNAPATGAWATAVEAGRLATARGHAFAGDDLIRAHVIERLMCDGAVDFDTAVPAASRDGFLELARRALRRWPGAAVLEGSRLRLADFRYARLVARDFDADTETPEAAFSQAS